MSSVAIIGAGIAGVTAAYFLAKEGYTVTVYEQESYPAMKCSYANGGQLSASNSETWHSWSNVHKGMSWMFRTDAPLLIRPGLDFDRAKWLVRFLINTAKNVREENTAKTIKLALESRQLYDTIATEEGISYKHANSGILHIYRDSKYFENAKSVQSLYENNGCEWKIIPANQIGIYEPMLAKDNTIIGGAWTKDDSVGDIHVFCKELMNVLRSKYKVTFMSGVSVDSVKALRAKYDFVVVAAGAESTKFSRELGDKNTIYPIKGYSITLTQPGTFIPKVSLLDDQAKIVTSTLGNQLRVAGTAELCGYNYDITRDRIEPLLKWVKRTFPFANTSQYSSWACLRPMTSDMMPMVCASRMTGVFYHTGHGHLGWTVAPATAKHLVGLLRGKHD